MSMSRTQTFGNYTISHPTPLESLVCFQEEINTLDTPWQMQNPMLQSVPYLASAIGFAIFSIRLFILLLKPLHQPRFIAEILTSIVVGPCAYGLSDVWKSKSRIKQAMNLFPFENTVLLETFSNIGLTFYMFLVGLEMDVSAIKRMDKKSLCIAFAGTVIPFAFGAALHFVPLHKGITRQAPPLGALFWAITLTITSFPDLARILSKVKLLHTDVGKNALSSAILNDITSWSLLVMSILIFNHYSQHNHSFSHSEITSILLATLPIISFVLLSWFVLRPCIAWMIKETKRRAGKFSDSHIYITLLGVIVFGSITDACGTHSLVGGFIFGLIIPNGELAINIMERTEEFVTGIWLPSFIVVSGLRTNFVELFASTELFLMLLVTIVATSAKILSTVLVGLYFGMPLGDAVSLGGLMNTKGVMALVVLNEGRSLKAIDNVLMAAMVLTVFIMTGLVGPIFFFTNKKAKRTRKYKQRTIQRNNPDTELRILTCIHSVGNLSGIINLLELSNATKKSPICVFAVHLVELTRRATAMLIVHDASRTKNNDQSSIRELADSDVIISAFRNYEDRHEDVIVQPVTAVSSFTTIHEDIFEIAEDKVVALILVPYHRQPSADGELQGENHQIREVNNYLLSKAPCSVGLLVDRGIGSAGLTPMHPSIPSKEGMKICMLFVGGPDDREALYYAWRISGRHGVNLTVVRFVQNKDVEIDISVQDGKNYEDDSSADTSEIEMEKEIDDEFVNEFRFKTMYDASITYSDKMVSNVEEMVESITKLYDDFELYIIGRGETVKSPLTMELSCWGDNPELGPVGETLVSSNSTAHASVLVLQQSASSSFRSESLQLKRKLMKQKWASPILNPEFKAYEKKNR